MVGSAHKGKKAAKVAQNIGTGLKIAGPILGAIGTLFGIGPIVGAIVTAGGQALEWYGKSEENKADEEIAWDNRPAPTYKKFYYNG
ncbi:hypothetical protein FACS189472_12760 [Alphaproteobacteria bacterium]|nr:hypothetical protein FACS189472_12760 [Alphaproteobacteria bacterium]